MDSRREPRLNTDQPVTVTILGTQEPKISGRIVNLSGRGLRLVLARKVPIGGAVKVEADNTMLFGDVVYCQPEGEVFAAGLELEHALYNVSQLARLAERLLHSESDDLAERERPDAAVKRSRQNQ